MIKFSQRIGKTSEIKQIQIESIDDDLLNRLWNCIKIYFIDYISRTAYSARDKSEYDIFKNNLWHNYFKKTIDSIPDQNFQVEIFIKNEFFSGAWYETYNLLEFLANIDTNNVSVRLEEFIQTCNEVLESEFSAYRFINKLISPITNKIEVLEIQSAIDRSGQFSSLKGVNIHLNSALEKISNKLNPDYRNSIKESISAVESVTKVISENSKDSLGGALDKIKGKMKIHPSLEKGFKLLYAYTSDSNGIRHALMDEHGCDIEDAIYMLVSSSAFINYLIVKADKAGFIFD